MSAVNENSFTNIPVSAGCTITMESWSWGENKAKIEYLTLGVPDERDGDMIVAVLIDIDPENDTPNVVEYFYAGTHIETVQNFATDATHLVYLEEVGVHDNLDAANVIHAAVKERELNADCFGKTVNDYAEMPESWVKTGFASQRLPI